MLPRHSSACAPPLPPPALPLPLLPLPPSLPPASCASASASTSMPRAMSPGVANSSGLWLQPLRQGMKTIPVGAICGGSMQGMCVAQTNIMACIKQQQQWNGSNTSRRARLNMQSPVPCSGIMKTHTIGESASKTDVACRPSSRSSTGQHKSMLTCAMNSASWYARLTMRLLVKPSSLQPASAAWQESEKMAASCGKGGRCDASKAAAGSTRGAWQQQADAAACSACTHHAKDVTTELPAHLTAPSTAATTSVPQAAGGSWLMVSICKRTCEQRQEATGVTEGSGSCG